MAIRHRTASWQLWLTIGQLLVVYRLVIHDRSLFLHQQPIGHESVYSMLATFYFFFKSDRPDRINHLRLEIFRPTEKSSSKTLNEASKSSRKLSSLRFMIWFSWFLNLDCSHLASSDPYLQRNVLFLSERSQVLVFISRGSSMISYPSAVRDQGLRGPALSPRKWNQTCILPVSLSRREETSNEEKQLSSDCIWFHVAVNCSAQTSRLLRVSVLRLFLRFEIVFAASKLWIKSSSEVVKIISIGLSRILIALFTATLISLRSSAQWRPLQNKEDRRSRRKSFFLRPCRTLLICLQRRHFLLLVHGRLPRRK